MRRLARASLSVLFVIVGCAEGAELDGSGRPSSGAGGAGGAGGEGTSSSSGAGGGGLAEQSCPAGEFATGVKDGKLECAGVEDLVVTAVNGACSVYFGWSDACTGCTTPPAKWGKVNASSCMNGVGVDDTCGAPALGGKSVQLFGLNTDGDVNDDDKLHVGFQCDEGDSKAAPGPCAPGTLMSGLSGQKVTCTPASGSILAYVRESCSLYFGWRDSCDACTTAPTKWGSVSTLGCSAGVGAGNTCSTPMLGGKAVQLFGLSVGGDVDGNDKLYVGLRCEPPKPAEGTAPAACPEGQLVTGIDDDGSLICASPAPMVADLFSDRCTFYFGWLDGCGGCLSPPAKWGAASANVCVNGEGIDNTCQTGILGGNPVELFGLSPDGDVNDDDKLYVGFRCD